MVLARLPAISWPWPRSLVDRCEEADRRGLSVARPAGAARTVERLCQPVQARCRPERPGRQEASRPAEIDGAFDTRARVRFLSALSAEVSSGHRLRLHAQGHIQCGPAPFPT